MARRHSTKRIATHIEKNANKRTAYQERVEKRTYKYHAEQLPYLVNPEDTPQNPLTHKRLMDWLASTGWIDGYVRKRISPMDANLYEDFAQHCWLEILSVRPERLMEIWYTGKGAFTNYIKKIIDVNLNSKSHDVYNVIKHFYHTHYMLSPEQWERFEEGDSESTFIDVYPERYECPSGNRKKMVRKAFEELPIHIDFDYSLTDEIKQQ